MGVRQPGLGVLAVSCMLAAASVLPSSALARSRHHAASSHHGASRAASRFHRASYRSAAGEGHVIQCVAFARADTGIQLAGNAANWWDNAAGVYARGSAPELGSVLNFRANARMRLGHVAVVSQVLNSRAVLIDQSHWDSRGVSRDISVIDVSPDNDWTAVRVALGHGGTYGSIYPTYGFIYPRADHSGVVLARATSDAPMIDANPAPATLRSWHRGRHAVVLEVAEAPALARGIDLSVGQSATQAGGRSGATVIGDDAPDRSLR